MARHLHIDIETYSSVDLKKSGLYKYTNSIDFEILCMAWSCDGENIYCTEWDKVPDFVLDMLRDPSVIKVAHNAAFERTCFAAVGIDTGTNWICTMVLSAYNGLPLSLADVSKALELGADGKSAEGAALIRFFCIPIKPTKTNGGRSRNLPFHDLVKWAAFLKYCFGDVRAELRIFKTLEHSLIPEQEARLYAIDQQINDRGVRVDSTFVESVLMLSEIDRAKMDLRAKELTGLSNPNSPAQLKNWISKRTGKKLTTLAADTLEDLQFDDAQVMELLSLRKQMSRSSVKKYDAMRNCMMPDERIRGLFQFYGASKTGRWAGRLVQVQNLPRNYMEDLESAREVVLTRNYESLSILFSDIQDVFAQLIRTAFIPSEPNGHLTTSDFSAIEARVVAWLANEEWRMEVFRSTEKKDIYIESASRMFGIPVDKITKEDRQKGKIAELALGYQGAVGALQQMGADKMGLNEAEMKAIVTYWRNENSSIVQLWYDVQAAAIHAIRAKKAVTLGNLIFECDNTRLSIQLPSGRKLFYWKARIVKNKYQHDSIQYMWSATSTKGKWSWVDTYGGKLVENITQAVARDFMAEAIIRIDDAGHKIVMHVHDEIVIEQGSAQELEKLMEMLPTWASNFPLRAVGEELKYYQK